jgi:hypothetical protein
MASGGHAGTLRVQRQAGVALVLLGLGSTTMATVGHLREALDEQVAMGDGVVVSLADVEFYRLVGGSRAVSR